MVISDAWIWSSLQWSSYFGDHFYDMGTCSKCIIGAESIYNGILSWRFQQAHNVISYEWGMYYPSVWAFSMWQAYNKAKTINARNEGKQHKEIELTGFFFGLTFGMNMGIYWHIPFVYDASMYLNFLESPVFCGLFFGIVFGWIGHRIEKRSLKSRGLCSNGIKSRNKY